MSDSKFPVKCILVTGAPGTKFDFVAGWLSTLPLFMNNFWHIDPDTGKSHGRAHIEGLDLFEINSIELELSHYNYKADASSGYYVAFPLSGNYLQNQISLDLIDSGAVKVVNIFFEIENRNTVIWDAMCQGYLADNRLYNIHNTESSLHIVEKIEELFDDYWAYNRKISYPITRGASDREITEELAIELSYTKLFVPGGSRYLCSMLGIEASERHHVYYDAMLPLSVSPDEIFQFGKLWKKSDYIVIDS